MRIFVVLALMTAAPAGAVIADVTDFGAKGDGRTDDRAAIQAAIESVRSTGGTVLLPSPGQYAVSSAIVLADLNSVTLRGEGAHPASCTTRGSSLLSLTANSTLVVIERSGHIIVSDLLLAHVLANTSDADRTNSASSLGVGMGATSSRAHSRHQHRHHRWHPRRVRADVHGSLVATDSLNAAPARTLPSSGVAVVVRDYAYDAILQRLWIEGVWGALEQVEFANTLTGEDLTVLEVHGPNAVSMHGGSDGARVDVMQLTRLTANQPGSAAQGFRGNVSVVWIDMGAGANTLRLDNVGLINGGVGLRMAGDPNGPPGVAPGRPLFVYANDLEIDFPASNAVSLEVGEVCTLSNAYIQGSQSANGILVGRNFDSEVQITNSRIFGHHLAGIEMAGGRHVLLSNNMIGDNSIAGPNASSAVVVRAGVSDFILSNNHIGAVFNAEQLAKHRFGIEIEAGSSQRYVVQGNTVTQNLAGGISDAGTGKGKSVANNVVA